MNKFLNLRVIRFVPFGLMVLAATLLLMPVAAGATPFVVKLVQQGNNVVANGSGSIDLNNLSCQGGWVQDAVIFPSWGLLQIGPDVSATEQCLDYNSFAGPSSFGTGSAVGPWSGGGNFVGVYMLGGIGHVFVPSNYPSNARLSGTSTWVNSSFVSLGVTPGKYIWTWGTGADQSFTLDIVPGVFKAPEPAALGMFGLGLLLISGFVGLRRRTA